MIKGLVHVYTGEGKGKTTAAVGLCVRAVGRGKRVAFVQFCKTAPTGEMEPLQRLGVSCFRMEGSFGFSFAMDEQHKAAYRQALAAHWKTALSVVSSGGFDLVVLDEAMGAMHMGAVSAGDLCGLCKDKPVPLELVFTGRGAPDALIALANYVSVISALKHPLEEGTAAREGVEY